MQVLTKDEWGNTFFIAPMVIEKPGFFQVIGTNALQTWQHKVELTLTEAIDVINKIAGEGA